MKRHRLVRPLAIALLLALAACATPTPTPYEPLTGPYGYAAEKLDSGDWRITFTANNLTPRGTAEDYALFRAAEFAREGGFDRFAVMDRSFDTHTERTYAYTTRPPGFESDERRFMGGSTYTDPFESTRIVSSERRTAMLVIRPFRGAAPAGAQRVYNTADEIARLGPTIRRR